MKAHELAHKLLAGPDVDIEVLPSRPSKDGKVRRAGADELDSITNRTYMSLTITVFPDRGRPW